MDGVLNKFSVFDFFNLIATGAIFSIGLELLEISIYDYLISYVIGKNEAIIDIIFSIAVITGICYIFGCCLQDIGNAIEKKYCRIHRNIISTFLNKPEIVGNEIKRMLYREKARKLFKEKMIFTIPEQNENFSGEQCRYFFSHCEYYLQVNEFNKKTEKMYEIQGLANMLMVCFGFLSIGGCFRLYYLFMTKSDVTQTLILSIIFSVLCIIFYFRMKKVILYRVRMILSTYDVSTDKNQNI